MKNLLVILTFLLLLLNVKAQEPAVGTMLKNIPGNYVSFSLDNLDNIYLLSATNQLKKLDAKGDSISVFNDVKKFGEATLVDVSNPLKILLYYKGFATVVVLDGMLNLKNRIDLRKKNIFNATALGLAYDGKIWLYDEMDNTLKKLDDDGNVIFKTADFRQLFDKQLSPIKIFDQNQCVYLYDSLQGVYVFDYYGSYKNRIDITHWQHFRIDGKYIYGDVSDLLYRYAINGFNHDEWSLPPTFKNCRQVFYRNKKWYALNSDGFLIYED